VKQNLNIYWTSVNTFQGWLNQLAEMNPISQQYLRKGGHSSEVCLIFPSACLVVRLSYNLTIQILNNHLSTDVPVMVSFIFLSHFYPPFTLVYRTKCSLFFITQCFWAACESVMSTIAISIAVSMPAPRATRVQTASHRSVL